MHQCKYDGSISLRRMVTRREYDPNFDAHRSTARAISTLKALKRGSKPHRPCDSSSPALHLIIHPLSTFHRPGIHQASPHPQCPTNNNSSIWASTSRASRVRLFTPSLVVMLIRAIGALRATKNAGLQVRLFLSLTLGGHVS